MTKGYTIAEAAEVLDVSTKTVRRRIHKGEIPAELVDGPYGQQYMIPADAIDTAQEIIDVVKVERPTDPMTLALTISKTLDERDRELQDEIIQLRQQVEELTKTLQERDRQLVEQLREVLEEQRTAKKPWWKRLFDRLD